MSFKLLLLQLGFTCSTAADKLRFILSDSQCFRAVNQGFPPFIYAKYITWCLFNFYELLWPLRLVKRLLIGFTQT